MLRASAKQAVLNTLEDSYFGESNFTVDYGNGKPFWVQVTFVGNTDFKFIITDTGSSSEGYQFLISEAPGRKFLIPENGYANSLDSSLMKVPFWIQRIKEEVVDSNPINRELQSVRKQLEERIELLKEGQEEFFTISEAAQLKEKLQEFSSKLDIISKTNAELKDAIQIQKTRIDELIGAADTVNKGTWLRMAGSKLLSTAKAVIGSKEGREFALETAKRVLLEGPK